MKRRVLSLGMALLLMIAVLPLSVYAADGVEIDEANFPDPLFRSYISENFDTDGDAFLSPDEIAAVTSINLSNMQVADLQGIRNFPLTSLNVSGCTVLENLNCSSNQLTNLNVSGCTALKSLDCNYNWQMTSLDISGCTALENLKCGGNRLIDLDVSECPALSYLDCRGTLLTDLDVSKHIELTTLLFDEHNEQIKSLNASGCTSLINLTLSYCLSNSSIESLDISGCTSLQELSLATPQLSSLNVNGCTSLRTLDCGGTQLTDLDISGCNVLRRLNCCNNSRLSSLDVRDCTALENLACSNSQLTDLDVSGCTALKELICHTNPMKSLNISGTAIQRWYGDTLPTLISLNASNCSELEYLGNISKMTDLDVSNCTSLRILDCGSSQLRNLNINGCTALKELNCLYSQLSSLDLRDCIVLTKLSCGGEFLTDLNVSGCRLLQELNCCGSRLHSLDISGCTALKVVCSIQDNYLTDLNASGCVSLQELNLFVPQLSSLNVSGCTALTRLVCVGSQLSSLDLSQNTALETLHCSDNQLNSLNLSQNTALKYLYCDNNQLSSLDLSQNTALETLYCSYNQLNSLDLSQNTALKYLYCDNNQLNSLDLDKEIKDLSAEAQISNLGIQKTSDGWTADLAKLVGEENLNKVEIKPEQGWQYDATAGTASYIGENMPVELIYYYNGNNFPTASMDVTVTLFESQKIRPCVVMKQGAEQAYVNGIVAPTTRYAAGYAKAENISGTMQMPLRYIAEVNGFTVDYDADTENIKVTNPSDGTYLLIILGNNIVTKHASDGTLIASSDIPLAFTVQNGVTVGPLRFTCEALGLAVSYQETAHGTYVVISQEVQTDENALAKIEEAYQFGL